VSLEPAVEAVQAAARVAGLADESASVVTMVSGGRDSVCLLHVAVALCGAQRVRALHVNYGLRPGADTAERLVDEMCAQLGVPLVVHHAARPAGAGNLQAWARDVRYGAATQLALTCGGVVAAGHTASDQVETVLYRLAASPGRRALLGMSAHDGLLRRPLLAVTREQTGAYCAALGLPYDDDESNASGRYARNRVRHDVVAALRDVHPAAELNVLRTAALLRDEAAVLDELVTETLAGRSSIAIDRLGALPTALARLVVIRLAEDAHGGLAPAAGGRLPELLSLGQRGGSASLDLGDGVRAIVEYGVLRMSAQAEPVAPVAVRLEVPGRVRFGEWELWGELDPSEDPRDDPPPPDVCAVIDADAASGPLVVRAWRHGDRMAPIGLGGSKSLADLFTDRRLPRARRATIPVIEAAGRVVWVPGIATDEGVRVGAATRRRLRLGARGGDSPR